MKKPRPLRRSVSPFGTVVVPALDPLGVLRTALQSRFGDADSDPHLSSWADARNIISFVERVLDAPANDVDDLATLCQYLVGVQLDVESAGLSDELFSAMEQIFVEKTESFLMSETILFSKERDMLIGRYFEPITERNPGKFSGFLSRWVESDHLDRLLHFLDFCKGTTNPTFEYFLVFSNPAFHRLLTNKHLLRDVWHKAEPLVRKLPDTTWADGVRTALGV